jgi:hypothetical protein
MRYVAATIGVLFLLGLVTGFLPVEVLVMLAVFALLAAAALTGTSDRNRVRGLRRAVFLNDSLMGYWESMSDRIGGRSDRRHGE